MRATRLGGMLTAVLLCFGLLAVPAPGRGASPAASAMRAPTSCHLNWNHYPTLRPGARRAEVRTLQCLLNQDGLGRGLVVDGWYGPATKAAVKRLFGTFEGMPRHPYVIKWWYWMILFAGRHDPRGLHQGDTGVRVRDLQRALRSGGLTLTVDGWFGPQTKGQLETFQRLCGMVPTGRVDDGTAFMLAMGGCSALPA